MTYEMLAGEPPFNGPTSQAIVARVLTESPPPLRPKRATVSPAVEQAVLTALQKLPADRFGSAREFADALDGLGKPSRHASTVALPAARPPLRPALQRLVPWSLAVCGLAFAGWTLARRPAQPATEWQYLALGAVPPVELLLPSLALSPDGQTLVFATTGLQGQLWSKRFTELEATPIPGTSSAIYPTFSPDGQWIAFTGDGTLRKVRPDGGGLTVIAESASRDFGGAAWLEDGTIVFTGPAVGELSRIPATGGTRTRAIPDDAFRGFGLGGLAPVPGARGVLFVACNSGCVSSELHVLDLRSGAHRRLVQDASGGWILPDGILLYMRRDGVMQAAPFDLERLEITGAGVPVVQGVFGSGGGTQFAWSPAGTVVYRPGAGTLAKAVPVQATRAGATTPIDPDWVGPFSHPVVAPDGQRIAVTAGVVQGDIGIWIKELPRGAFTRLTFGGQDRRPEWSPDGRTVAFIRDTLAGASVWARPADGSREPYRLSPPGIWAQGVTWSPDGTWLAIRTDNGDSTHGDIVGIRLGADGTPAPPVPLVASPFGELHPAFSPDGKWLAYTSDESGVNEVFVRPFPNTTAARWQVSNGGGEQPQWSPDGRALFYLERTTGRLVEARLRTAPLFAVLERVPLFAGDNVSIDPFHQSFDVWPDGSGFLFVRTSNDATGSEPLVLGRHWFTDVRARLRP
ncbi:MAG: hypothetical protein MUC69_06105 [Gemmatimonadales bacterium]|nr:hypothetical protein [Gemmatimonadales bacterium]